MEHAVMLANSATLPDIPSTLELCIRIVAAGLMAGAIGLERELTDHPSGIRTHLLVGIGACLFGIFSAYAFTEFIALRDSNNYQIDVTRVASQVVVGVGFLGGGAIIKHGNSIRGLTSAAGLWVSSAIGLGMGLGMYAPTITALVTILIALVILRAPRRWIRTHFVKARQNIVVRIPLDSDPGVVITALEKLSDCVVESIIVRRRPDDSVTVVEADVYTRGGQVLLRMNNIQDLPNVLSVEVI